MHDAHPLPPADLVVDGVRLSVTRHGRPAGAPLLLLHGFPTTAYLWHDVMRDLGREHDLIAPDLVGLGLSEHAGRGRYALPAQAQLFLRLLDDLGVGQVAACGHGLGGAVAVHLAAAAPERVRGLVLLDAPVHADAWPVPPVLPLLVPVVGELLAAGLRRSPAAARAVLARAISGPAAWSERQAQPYLAVLHRPGGAASAVRFARSVDLAATERDWELLRTLVPPTLVLWGEEDHLHSTAYGRRIAAEMPRANWVPVADAGHLLPQQRPERVAEEIGGFLAELAAA